MATITKTHISKIESNSAHQYLSTNLKTVSSNIDRILQNVDTFYIPLLTDRDFTTTVGTLSPYDSRKEYQDFLDTTTIYDTISKTASFNNYIYSIYTYSTSANRFFSSKMKWNPAFHHFDKTNAEWLINYEYNNPKDNWIFTTAVEDGRPILTSYRTIKRNSNILDGIVSINIDASVISKQLKNVLPDDESFCFMTDSDFNIISSSDSKEENKQIYNLILKAQKNEQNKDFFPMDINHEKMFVFSLVSENTGFRYYIISPRKNIMTISSMVTQLSTGYFIFIFLLILLLSSLAVFIFFRPIKQLFNGMQSIQEGNFNIRLPENSNYEFNYINEHFNSMAENIQQLIYENYEQTLLRREAELHNIQNQLNEHFLYNTLDSIRWSARSENALQTSKMVYSLATFYRINLSSGIDFIPVSQIIQMLESYLSIQKVRIGDQFTYTLTCTPELSTLRVLKYLFQPLVENSLIHGLNGITHNLDIHISFLLSDNSLCFTVSDNGIGINQETLLEIEKNIRNHSDDNSEYFALKIIYQQLETEYHAGDSLHIDTRFGEYCKISFRIPLSNLGGNLYDRNDNY